MSLLNDLLYRPLMTKQDLAQRYKVNERTIRRWTATGYLPKPAHIAGPRWTPFAIFNWEKKNVKRQAGQASAPLARG